MHRLGELRSDVRFACRQLRRAPGFTAVAALTLALGLGANSAIFALVDATLLHPVPFNEPDRLVMVSESLPRFRSTGVSSRNLDDWEIRNRTFESMAGVFAYVVQQRSHPQQGVVRAEMGNQAKNAEGMLQPAVSVRGAQKGYPGVVNKMEPAQGRTCQ